MLLQLVVEESKHKLQFLGSTSPRIDEAKSHSKLLCTLFTTPRYASDLLAALTNVRDSGRAIGP